MVSSATDIVNLGSSAYEIIETAGYCTQYDVTDKIPDIGARLGDLREEVVESIGPKSRLVLLMALISMEIGQASASASEYDVAQMISCELNRVCSLMQSLRPSVFGKYLFVALSHKDVGNESEDPFERTNRLGHWSVCWRDLQDEQQASWYSTIISDLESQASEITRHTQLICKLSFKLIEVGLAPVSASTMPSVIALRKEVGYVLSRMYYELNVGIKLQFNPRNNGHGQNAGTEQIVDLFCSERNGYQRGRISIENARESISQALYAVPLCVDHKELHYSPRFAHVTLREAARQSRIAESSELCSFLEELSRLALTNRKFPVIANEWLYTKLVNSIDDLVGSYYVLVDMHDVEHGVIRLNSCNTPYLTNGEFERNPIGNLRPLLELTDYFLGGHLSPNELIGQAFELRCKQQAIFADYFRVFSGYNIQVRGGYCPCFYLVFGSGDGVRGFAESVLQVEDAISHAEQATEHHLISGAGLAQVVAGITYSTLQKRAEFSLHVTKLFKGTSSSLARLHVWGDVMTDIQAAQALDLMTKRHLSSIGKPHGSKIVAKLYHFQDMWTVHLPSAYHSEFRTILQRCKELTSNVRR